MDNVKILQKNEKEEKNIAVITKWSVAPCYPLPKSPHIIIVNCRPITHNASQVFTDTTQK